MYRFYIDDNQYDGEFVRVTGSDVNHISNVLRLQKGDWVILCNGEGTDYTGRIEEFEPDEVLVKILKVSEAGSELPSKIYLFQGLPKSDKMEFIIQKAVETGVFEVIPVNMKRCVKKINEEKKLAKKLARWNQISEAAAKQSGRGIVPSVKSIMSFKEALEYARSLDYTLMPYELEEVNDKSRENFREAITGKSIGIFIGPEGGIDESEVQLALENGVKAVSLGKRILRTETAGIVTTSFLIYLMEIEGC